MLVYTIQRVDNFSKREQTAPLFSSKNRALVYLLTNYKIVSAQTIGKLGLIEDYTAKDTPPEVFTRVLTSNDLIAVETDEGKQLSIESIEVY